MGRGLWALPLFSPVQSIRFVEVDSLINHDDPIVQRLDRTIVALVVVFVVQVVGQDFRDVRIEAGNYARLTDRGDIVEEDVEVF